MFLQYSVLYKLSSLISIRRRPKSHNFLLLYNCIMYSLYIVFINLYIVLYNFPSPFAIHDCIIFREFLFLFYAILFILYFLFYYFFITTASHFIIVFLYLVLVFFFFCHMVHHSLINLINQLINPFPHRFSSPFEPYTLALMTCEDPSYSRPLNPEHAERPPPFPLQCFFCDSSKPEPPSDHLNLNRL